MAVLSYTCLTCVWYITINIVEAPDFKPTHIASADWCVEGLSAYIAMDLLALYDDAQLWVSNYFEPAVKIDLPVSELEKLAFGADYSYEIFDVTLDIKPGKIGVSLKLTISEEYKVGLRNIGHIPSLCMHAGMQIEFTEPTLDYNTMMGYFASFLHLLVRIELDLPSKQPKDEGMITAFSGQ